MLKFNPILTLNLLSVHFQELLINNFDLCLTLFQQMLVTVSEQCDQKIMGIREEEKQGRNAKEPLNDKTNKMNCGPSKDLDQPGHPPSLIRVFAVHMKKHWALNFLLCAQ